MVKQKTCVGSVIETIKEIAEPLCQSENIEFVYAETLSECGSALVRIYIDKLGGITIDDCIYMSRQLGDLFDIHLEDVEPYRLEVSSPGLNRPLTKPSDFERFKGEYVNVEIVPFEKNGQKRFAGLNDGIEGDIVTLIVDRQRVYIKFAQIKKAKLSGAAHGE